MNAVVLGGTHDHIHVINSLKKLGYYVYLIDFLDNPIAKDFASKHIQISTKDTGKVAEFCIEIKAQLVVSLCIDSALATSVIVSDELSLPKHVSKDVVKRLRDKNLMKVHLILNKILTPSFYKIDEFDTLESLSFDTPKVLKPVDSSSSKGVFKVNCKSELFQKHELTLKESHSRLCIIEDFVEGKEYSVDYYILNGEAKLLSVSQNIKGFNNDGFVITGSYYDPNIMKQYFGILTKIGNRLALINNIENGPLLAQFIRNEESFYLIEYSPRLGGGSKYCFIETICGVDVVKETIKSLLGQSVNISPEYSSTYHYIRYVYVEPIESLDFIDTRLLNESEFVQDVLVYKKSGTKVTSRSSSADRVFGIIFKAKDIAELRTVELKIKKIVDIISKLSRNKYIYTL